MAEERTEKECCIPSSRPGGHVKPAPLPLSLFTRTGFVWNTNLKFLFQIWIIFLVTKNLFLYQSQHPE